MERYLPLVPSGCFAPTSTNVPTRSATALVQMKKYLPPVPSRRLAPASTNAPAISATGAHEKQSLRE